MLLVAGSWPLGHTSWHKSNFNDPSRRRLSDVSGALSCLFRSRHWICFPPSVLSLILRSWGFLLLGLWPSRLADITVWALTNIPLTFFWLVFFVCVWVSVYLSMKEWMLDRLQLKQWRNRLRTFDDTYIAEGLENLWTRGWKWVEALRIQSRTRLLKSVYFLQESDHSPLYVCKTWSCVCCISKKCFSHSGAHKFTLPVCNSYHVSAT